MDWVKLRTTYYNDPALMRAGEAAEVLFVRGMAYAGEQETDGVIPRQVIPRLTPTKGTARARALVAAGLWATIPEGWRIVGWDQIANDELDRRRTANRERQKRYRSRQAPVSDGVTDAVTNASVTPIEVEVEVDAAAAASRYAAAAAELAPPIAILRDRLRAHTALQAVRFDAFSPTQEQQLLDLIDVHGDTRLVEVAIRTFRPPGPTFIQALIGTWQALPAPGQTVKVADDPPCTVPGHTGTTRHCAGCAADARAVDR